MHDTPSTHSSLLQRIRDPRDQVAWDEFVSVYAPLIHRYCQRRGLQDTDAADVVQNVLMAVLRAIGSFERQPVRGAFRSWLFTITRNKFNDFIEARNRQPIGVSGTTVRHMLEVDPCPETDELWDREYQQCLFQWACKQVNPEFEATTWQAFWMTAVEHRSGQETSQALGLTLGAVYIAKSRVLSRLRKRVQHVSDDSQLMAD